MTLRAFRSIALGTALFCALSPKGTVAQEETTGFRFSFGWQAMGGDMGSTFDGTVDAEFSILIPVWRLRVGGGANWASFDVSGEKESWNQIRFHGLVGMPFQLTEKVHPYLEGRWTYRRLRPEDDRFFGGEDKLLRDFKASGQGFEGVAGLAVFMGPRVALDVSAAFGAFSFSPDLSEEGLGSVDSGTSWRFDAGVSWFPFFGR